MQLRQGLISDHAAHTKFKIGILVKAIASQYGGSVSAGRTTELRGLRAEGWVRAYSSQWSARAFLMALI